MSEEEDNKYSRLKLEALKIYGDCMALDIYLKLSSDKYVKVANANEDSKAVLEKYQAKGVEFVFLESEQFTQFAQKVRLALQKKMLESNQATTVEPVVQKAKVLSSAHDILKNIIASGKIDEESKELAKEMTKETTKLITHTKIIDKFMEFKKNCSDEYMHALATSFVACLMIDDFDWPSSQQIKEKVVMAAMLCDIALKPEDFFAMKMSKGDKDKLSTKILNHPLESADLVGNDSKFISPESLTIIKQHHERPNGKGYPKGIGHQIISPLTAVYIVANTFTERMFDENFNDEHKGERMQNIVSGMRERYSVGGFRKPFEALNKYFGQVA